MHDDGTGTNALFKEMIRLEGMKHLLVVDGCLVRRKVGAKLYSTYANDAEKQATYRIEYIYGMGT